jgi:glycosyltransferase involved in cell wall biosynthesis
VRVTVAVCTFRRPQQLGQLLEHLDRLEYRRCTPPSVEVLVVDNDPDGAAAPVVSRARQVSALQLRYTHLGARNISTARNEALRLASVTADFIALIDDDEAPEPQWLDELLATQEATDADVVCGPVRPKLPQHPPTWFRPEFYAVAGFDDLAELDDGITGNALVRSGSLARLGLGFDEELGVSGGEDQVFFRSARAAGATIRWAAGADATEFVGPERLTVRYLFRREYRKGNTLGLLDRGRPGWPSGRPVRRVLAAVKWSVLGVLGVLAGTIRYDPSAAVAGGMRMARSAGMVTGLTGRRFDLYGTGSAAAPGRPSTAATLAVVTAETAEYQRAGHAQFLGGFIEHYRSLGLRVVVIVTNARLGFVARVARPERVEYVSPALRRWGRWDVVASPRSALGQAGWFCFRAAPHALQRAVDGIRRNWRAGRGVDHVLGTPLDRERSAWVTRQLQELQPDAVLFFTVFSLPESIDLPRRTKASWVLTSDVMSDRARAFRRLGYRISPHHFTEHTEAAALGRLPRLVAIQWDDAERLRRLVSGADVVVSPVAFPARCSNPGEMRPGRCLFVGSGSLHNVDGLQWLLDRVWPLVRARCPTAELHVVGSVCARVRGTGHGVELRGEVPDLEAEYAGAVVALVPLRAGSGLKVKLVEAICSGRAIVTTGVGAQGLLSLEPRPFALADDPACFASAVVDLLDDPLARARLQEAARECAALFSPEQVYRELDDRLAASGVRMPPPSAPSRTGPTVPS